MKRQTESQRLKRRLRSMRNVKQGAIPDEDLRRDPSLPRIADLPFEPIMDHQALAEAVKKVIKERLRRPTLKAKSAGSNR